MVTYIIINVWISPSVESLGDRTPTHIVLINVSGCKTSTYKVSTSSRSDLIPPSRRGSNSADIRVISSSSADAQFARCAARSSTYSCSSAKFCQATRTSLLATARIWWWSTTGQEQTAATVCRDSRSIGSGSISDSRFVLAMHKSAPPVMTSRVVV